MVETTVGGNSQMQINDGTALDETTKKERNLRDEYFAEKKRIVEQLGSLDQIRTTLGLNRRQMCRLLLVDPSAWTRWVRTEAPPHIYQALRWLLELRGIRPDVIGPTNFSTRLDEMQSSMQSKIHDLERHIQMLERTLALTRIVVERQADTRNAQSVRTKIKRPKKAASRRSKKSSRGRLKVKAAAKARPTVKRPPLQKNRLKKKALPARRKQVKRRKTY